jgi:hypothetical protein
MRTSPPAFQKYLAWFALGNVMVWVNVMVQAVCPEPVTVVFDVVPENTPYSVPLAAALPRLFVTLVKSVLSAAKILMVSPAMGDILEVSAVPVCRPAEARLLFKLDHCVAVTVAPAEGFETTV